MKRVLMIGILAGLLAGSAAAGVNFIQILTDDQGWGDLGSFGHQFIKTPHIDRLAAEGIKLTRCYSAEWKRENRKLPTD